MNILVAALLALASTGVMSTLQGPAAAPLEFYKGYLAVLAKATTMKELLPYYSKELSDGLRQMPTDMQANYLKMNAKALSDLKVTKQTVEANKAVFEMTAKTPDGRTTTGSATLVKEGGRWKVDDEMWAEGAVARGRVGGG